MAIGGMERLVRMLQRDEHDETARRSLERALRRRGALDDQTVWVEALADALGTKRRIDLSERVYATPPPVGDGVRLHLRPPSVEASIRLMERARDNSGRYSQVYANPDGYWVDFIALPERRHWERLERLQQELPFARARQRIVRVLPFMLRGPQGEELRMVDAQLRMTFEPEVVFDDVVWLRGGQPLENAERTVESQAAWGLGSWLLKMHRGDPVDEATQQMLNMIGRRGASRDRTFRLEVHLRRSPADTAEGMVAFITSDEALALYASHDLDELATRYGQLASWRERSIVREYGLPIFGGSRPSDQMTRSLRGDIVIVNSLLSWDAARVMVWQGARGEELFEFVERGDWEQARREERIRLGLAEG